MTNTEASSEDVLFRTRLVRVAVSIVVLSGVTVVLGYGGWLVLSITARFGYDPETADGTPLRQRLAAWPDRNRKVMRSNGHTEFPLRP